MDNRKRFTILTKLLFQVCSDVFQTKTYKYSKDPTWEIFPRELQILNQSSEEMLRRILGSGPSPKGFVPGLQGVQL